MITADKRSWRVCGIEPSVDARLRSREKKMELLSNLDQIKNKKFQVITLWHVLEHLPDLNDDIQKIKSLLNEEGTLVIAVPNFKSFDANYYKEFWAAYDVPRHLWHFSTKSIEGIFAKHGMRLIKKSPMWFDAFYVSLLSEKYKSGNSNFLRALFVGFKSNVLGLITKEYSSVIYILKKNSKGTF